MSKGRVAAAGLALAAGIVMYFEGYHPTAYRDPIGIPTVCYGHTAGVEMGDAHTKAECREMLDADLQAAWDAVDRLVTVDLKPHEQAAFASFVYNVGERKFAASTMLKLINAGRIHDACTELLRWNMAGGKVLPGLVKRREAEHQVCLGG